MPTDKPMVPTILVIDDDADLLQLVEFKLKAEGFHVFLSVNGENVREIIAQTRPDLILLDIHMYGVSGGDICHEIKSNPDTCSIPVLLFSANDNIKKIAEDCGADGYITKPLESDNLNKVVRRFIPGMAER